MPTTSTLLLFSGASILLLVIPGPAVTYIVARSMAQGRHAGLVSVLGIHAGSIVHVVAAVIGLSALVASSALAYESVKLIGAVYLVYLGISRILRKDGGHSGATSELPLRRVFMQGMVVNVLNPKTSLFFLAFLPQFVDPAAHVALQTLILGATFILLGMVSDSCYALAAAGFARLLHRSSRMFEVERWLSGGALIALGVTAALSGRPQRA
jgi:threonine/homoserine/homoserine lactone efflux protein